MRSKLIEPFSVESRRTPEPTRRAGRRGAAGSRDRQPAAGERARLPPQGTQVMFARAEQIPGRFARSAGFARSRSVRSTKAPAAAATSTSTTSTTSTCSRGTRRSAAIVGAYRIGHVDEILAKHGRRRSLYAFLVLLRRAVPARRRATRWSWTFLHRARASTQLRRPAAAVERHRSIRRPPSALSRADRPGEHERRIPAALAGAAGGFHQAPLLRPSAGAADPSRAGRSVARIRWPRWAAISPDSAISTACRN